jgi:hypothetical protein
MKIVLILTSCCFFGWNALSAPTSQPAESTLKTDSIMKGAIVFNPPANWKLEGKSDSGRLAAYSTENPKSILIINDDPQEQVLNNDSAVKVGQLVVGNVKKTVASKKMELIDPPKIEKDERFFLRVHHRFKNKEGETGDELQIYQVVGKNLISVATTVFTDSEEASKPRFEEAEKMLLSVKGSGSAAAQTASGEKHQVAHPATKPTTLAQAKLRYSPPVGWQEELNDQASGLVATYKDLNDAANMLVIRVEQLPKEARSDPKLREVAIDQIVQGERAELSVPGAQPVGSPEKVTDNRFLRKDRMSYESKDAKFKLTSRVKRAGDKIVCIAMLSRDENAAENEKLADDVAVTMRAPGQ